MRNLRKLLLVMASVVVALTFSASGASAQAVEVSNETTGVHCSDFMMVNHEPVGETCTLRAESERNSILVLHNSVVETPFSSCHNIFEAAVNGDGLAYIYNQELTPEGGTCGREPCDESAEGATPHKNIEWPAEIREVAEDQLRLHVVFCLYAHNPDPASEGTAGTPCEVLLNLEDEAAPDGHEWEVGTPPMDPDGNGGAPCINLGGAVELSGHWLLQRNEAHPDSVIIEHL